MTKETTFENIHEAIRFFNPNHELLNSQNRNGIGVKENGEHIYVPMYDGSFALVRRQYRNWFYRGENDIFDSCKSSLYRIKDDDIRLLELLKSYYFISFINKQPEVVSYRNKGLHIDLWMLAQHYEFKTPVIDLTDEIAVAAFFATHDYDPITKSYIVKKSGVGVIRYCDMSLVDSGNIQPVGLQPFGRPSQQDGFALILKEEQDFANLSNNITFKQDPVLNQRLHEAMIGGFDYFPLERISLMAKTIHNGDIITNESIEYLLNDQQNGLNILNRTINREEIVKFAKRKNIHITDVDTIPSYVSTFQQWGVRIRPLVQTKAYNHIDGD